MRRTRIVALVALIAALIAALTGCVKSDDTENAAVNDASAASALDLPDNPRVVALGWSDGAIALELGVKPVAIYDWQAFGEATKGVGEWDVAKFGDDTPELMTADSSGNFNYQKIRELNPDVILNVRAANDDAVLNQLRNIAPVITAPEGSGAFAVNWRDQTRLIGAALGKSTEADALISETDAAISQVKDANPDFAGKTFVYGVKFGDAYGAYLAGDARFDLFAELGFVQNPPILSLQSSGFFANIPVERVGDLNAQVAILSEIGLGMQALRDDARINALEVVQQGRAVEIAGDDPRSQALSAGTPVSLKFALEGIAPELTAAAAKVTP